MLYRTTILASSLLLALAGCTSSNSVPPAAQTPRAADGASPNETVQRNQPAEGPAIVTHTNAPTEPASNGDRPKLKSRFGRSLVEQLDRVEGGTGEERNLIHETLRKNDDTVDRAMSNMSDRIRAANNTHDGPRRIAIPAP